jgi:hypothetical protein
VKRRSFKIHIVVNSRRINQVVIDPHYEEKHSETISDKLILDLVNLLDGGDFVPEAVNKGFEYYTNENLAVHGKRYRLVWLLEKDQLYIGVINAYRRK